MKYYFLFTIILVGCNYEYSNYNTIPENINLYNSVGVEIVGERIFEKAEEINARIHSMSHVVVEGASILSFFDRVGYKIHFMDYNSGEIVNEIDLKMVSCVELNNVTGHKAINIDSVLVYDYSSKIVALLNESGECKQVYDIREGFIQNVDYPPNPYAHTIDPIIYTNDKLVLSGFIVGESNRETKKNRPVSIVYDILSDSAYYSGYYPEIYHEANWGGTYYRYVYHTYNPHQDIIVYSFPAEHFIYYSKLNELGGYERKYAGNLYFNEIKSLSYSSNIVIPQDISSEHYKLNNSYNAIFYDEYRRLYYRFSNGKLTSPRSSVIDKLNNQSIIILDDDFNYLGQVDLNKIDSIPSPVYTYGVFINNEGLNIQLFDDDIQVLKYLTISFNIN